MSDTQNINTMQEKIDQLAQVFAGRVVDEQYNTEDDKFKEIYGNLLYTGYISGFYESLKIMTESMKKGDTETENKA